MYENLRQRANTQCYATRFLVNDVCVCVRICRTQAVIEKVQEHEHAAAHDHKHTDHDWGDVHRLLVLLLRAVIPLVLHVASVGGENTFKGDRRPEVAFWMLRTLKD